MRLPGPAFSCLAVAMAWPFFAAFSQENAVDEARAGEARQTEIQTDAVKLAAQLDAMLDEYRRNGVADDDAKSVKALRSLISGLSQQDMSRILRLLQDAASKGDPHAALKSVSDAYAQQKGVISQLKHVMADYEHRQEADELSQAAKDLADRQSSNLQAGLAAAEWSLDSKHTEEEVNATVSGMAAEEKSIADEMKLLQAKVASLARDPANAAMAERLKKGLDQMSKVSAQVDGAANDLGQKKLFNGVEQEKAARDAMRQMARTIAQPKDPVDALRGASEDLDKAIAQQQSLNEETKLVPIKPIAEWAADALANPKSPVFPFSKGIGLDKSPAEQVIQDKRVQGRYKSLFYQAQSQYPDLASRQGDVLGQNDTLSQDLDAVAKPAADDLRAAVAPLQGAWTAIGDRNAEAAMPQQQQGLEEMLKAQADLHQQLAAAEKAQEQSSDPAARLQNLQTQTQSLLKAQSDLAAAATAAASPQQAAAAAQAESALRDKANALAQQAAADAPAAAQSVAKAAANLQQANAALANAASPAANAQAATAQNQAMQNLAAANQQIAGQIRQQAQAAAEAAAAQQALDGLTKIIADEQQLQLDTVQKTAAQPAPTATASITELAPRQATISTDFETFRKGPAAAAGTPGAAPAKLATLPEINQGMASSAAGHMDVAKLKLSKGDGKAADPAERSALNDLYSLQNKLQALTAQAQSAQQAQDAQAAAALAQAQAQTAQATSDLGQAQAASQQPAAGQQPAPGAPPQPAQAPGQQAPGQPAAGQQAAGELSQAASTAGQAAAAAAGLPAGTQNAIRTAAEDLAAASAQAAAGNQAAAAADAQSGADALAQAQSALAQAQTGISGAAMASSDGGPPGPPVPNATGTGPPGSDSMGNPPPPGGKKAEGVAGRADAHKGQFLGLPARDRATIQQAQAEKYPQEYAAQIEQYLQNLSDESSRH